MVVMGIIASTVSLDSMALFTFDFINLERLKQRELQPCIMKKTIGI